jgi:hypothetical protein
MFDVFHSWCEPDLHDRIRRYGGRINSVQVCDVRVDERSGHDRELPGRGRGTAAGIIASLLEAGYDGYWELEVFSDDGTYGNDFPDSYWKLPHAEFLAMSKAALRDLRRRAAHTRRTAGRRMMTALDPGPRQAPLCPVVHGRPYDPLSPEAAIDPEPWLSLARAEQPVFYLPEQDVWCVTRYADIREVLRNPATYSSRYANKFRPMTSAGLREVYPNGHPGLHSMLLKDPPEHSRVRRLANTAFTPKMVAAMEPRIRARCHALIDAFIADGHCELVSQYSSELTVGTMMDISSAPKTLGEEFARWGQHYFSLTAGAPPLTAEQERDLVARALLMTAVRRVAPTRAPGMPTA